MAAAAENSDGLSSGEDKTFAVVVADCGANLPSGLDCATPTDPAAAQHIQKRHRTSEDEEPAKIGRAKTSDSHLGSVRGPRGNLMPLLSDLQTKEVRLYSTSKVFSVEPTVRKI
ncbi:UNVERIFIED_CONTAM: hypothetical protein K2H54_055350 [Gekko kuhli]